jgi:hypothetical protein
LAPVEAQVVAAAGTSLLRAARLAGRGGLEGIVKVKGQSFWTLLRDNVRSKENLVVERRGNKLVVDRIILY